MKRRMLAFLCTGVGLAALAACSGQTTSSPSSGGAGGASGSGGTGELGGSGGSSACPDDLEVRSGPACDGVTPGCASGSCLHAYGVWACASPCPCGVGWFCGWFGDRSGCVPDSLAGCVQPGGTGGSGGAGGSGGIGGMGGTGGTGIGGTGGTGFGGTGGTGSGGTGPCSGDPACYGGEASFCSTDAARLLSCTPADECPTVTSCLSYCPACACHMSPPVNGVLRGTCDTCTSDSECSSPLKCMDNPMFPGSGAKTCVAP